MKKYKNAALSLTLILLGSCQISKTNNFYGGVYSTYTPDLFNSIAIKNNLGISIDKNAEMQLQLSEDSTYKIAFCDLKISTKGNWIVRNDTLVLYNNYSLRTCKTYFNEIKILKTTIRGHDYLFYPFEFQSDTSNTPQRKIFFTSLKINGSDYPDTLAIVEHSCLKN